MKLQTPPGEHAAGDWFRQLLTISHLALAIKTLQTCIFDDEPSPKKNNPYPALLWNEAGGKGCECASQPSTDIYDNIPELPWPNRHGGLVTLP